MANFKVNSVPSWVQYTATNGQTQFSIPFPFIDNADLSIWQNGILLTITTDYTLSGEQTTSGGLLTLNTGASLNDQIVIQDLMVIDRTNIYQPTISALTGSALNEDFNRDVIMIRDTTTTVNYLMLQYAPYADISQDITDTTDRIIPILGPLQTWQKDPTNSFIQAVALPTIPVGIDGNFTETNRVTTTYLVPGPNYIQQTDLQYASDTLLAIGGNLTISGTNDVILQTVGNVTFLPGLNINLDGALWPTSGAAAGKFVGFGPSSSTLLGFYYVASAIELQNSAFTYADDTGTENAFEIALNPAVTSYVAGLTVFFKAANTNSDACTLNVNGLGAVNFNKDYDSPLISGDILADQIVEATFDGATFQMMSPTANTVDGGGVNPGVINQVAYYASSGNIVSGSSTLLVSTPSSQTNYLKVEGGATGDPVSLIALGSDSAINIAYIVKGESGHYFYSDTGIGMTILPAVNAVNYVQVVSNTTGEAPGIAAQGDDTDIILTINAKGSGSVRIGSDGLVTLIVDGAVADQVNYIVMEGSATGDPVAISSFGGDTNVPLQLNSNGNAGVQIEGCEDGSSAPTGYVGEIISNSATSVSMTTTASKNITSITLTPGDWDVMAALNVSSSGMTLLTVSGGLSLTSATLPSLMNRMALNVGGTGGPFVDFSGAVPTQSFSVSTNTVVYLVGLAAFNTGTVSGNGYISARRVR